MLAESHRGAETRRKPAREWWRLRTRERWCLLAGIVIGAGGLWGWRVLSRPTIHERQLGRETVFEAECEATSWECKEVARKHCEPKTAFWMSESTGSRLAFLCTDETD